MFSFLKKSESSVPYTDKIWKHSAYAMKGMFMMAMMRLQQGKSCLLVYFFESEGEKLIRFMQEHKLNFVLWDESINDCNSPSLYLVNAMNLSKPNVGAFSKQSAIQFSGEALFYGHYPISSVEKTALQSLVSAGFEKFIFCLSFDDPLLKSFGTQNILPLLEKLGLEEEESIEHNLVTQSIKRAREKVEANVKQEVRAKSPEEWFVLNLKKM